MIDLAWSSLVVIQRTAWQENAGEQHDESQNDTRNDMCLGGESTDRRTPPPPHPHPQKRSTSQKESCQSIFLVESERSASGGELVDLDHGLAHGGCRVAKGVGGGVGESGKRAPGCNQRGAGRIRMRAHLRAPASSLSWVTRTGSSKMPHGTWQCERDSGASALARGRARSSPLRASIWLLAI